MGIAHVINGITVALHSKYGASSSYRWLNCPASVAMSEGKPDEPDEFSEIGIAGHELGEFCLRTGLNAFDCLGLFFNSQEVDAVMAEAVQLYISYIRDLCRKYNVNPMLEKLVVMTSVRDDVYGTSDCIVIVGEWLFVIDYKHGHDVVEVKDNSQAIHYAVSTLDTLNLWSTIKYIQTSIVQPHSYHCDGSIRHHVYETHQLIAWKERFRKAIELAESGSKPVAGDWCKRCPASGTCYARFMRSVQLSFVNGELTPQSLIPLFKEMSVIEKHFEAVKKVMLDYARKGCDIEGYKLVKSLPRAKCIDEEGFVKSAAFMTGRNESEFYNLKLKGKGDCQKLVNNDTVLIDDYFKRPDTSSTTLVPLSDSRPAISVGSAVGVFSPVTQSPRPSAAGIFEGVK